MSRKGVLLGGSWGLIGEENIRPVTNCTILIFNRSSFNVMIKIWLD
jgi:hypothetical protein